MYAATHAESHPEKPALILAETGEQLTFAQYEMACNRLAHLYRDAGLRRGDHIALFMENNLPLLVGEGAAERTGLYYTCVNSHLSAGEAAYIVDNCGARLVLTSAVMMAAAAELPALCPRVERWLVVETDMAQAPFERYEDLVKEYSATPIADEQLGTAMLYSSGTTGRPKGIQRELPDFHPGDQLPVMEVVKYLQGLREGMTYLSPAPLYHSAPQTAVATALRMGATSVIMKRFDAARLLELVQRYQVTHAQLVPTMFSRLLKLPEETRLAADVSSLECVSHAGAPCPVEVKEQMIDWWGPILLEYYSATEGHGATVIDSKEWLTHRGSVGKSILGEILILDDEYNECPIGETGTVWFRGAGSFEYFDDKEKTAAAKGVDGASTVGDVGYVDAEGYLYLTDRKAYMIISGGVNIYPQETENLLTLHPKVVDVAVFGVPNADLGEEVKAVVQLAAGESADTDTERELIDFCRENLAHYKCPRSVDFEEELPRLPTGKLYKRLLRERYWPATP